MTTIELKSREHGRNQHGSWGNRYWASEEGDDPRAVVKEIVGDRSWPMSPGEKDVGLVAFLVEPVEGGLKGLILWRVCYDGGAAGRPLEVRLPQQALPPPE